MFGDLGDDLEKLRSSSDAMSAIFCGKPRYGTDSGSSD
jgi:hypothetical protein